jgi:hypothetical protein
MKPPKNGIRLTVNGLGVPPPFLKKPPLSVKHPQKLLIKGGHSLQLERIFRQTMTAFTLFLFLNFISPLLYLN